jgi:hypothetical protein
MMSDDPFCCVHSEFSLFPITVHSSGDSKCSKLKFSEISGEMNGTKRWLYISLVEMHDGCFILQVIRKTLVMIEMSFFSADGKAKLKKITLCQVLLERTFNGEMKRINIDLGTGDRTLSHQKDYTDYIFITILPRLKTKLFKSNEERGRGMGSVAGRQKLRFLAYGA